MAADRLHPAVRSLTKKLRPRDAVFPPGAGLGLLDRTADGIEMGDLLLVGGPQRLELFAFLTKLWGASRSTHRSRSR